MSPRRQIDPRNPHLVGRTIPVAGIVVLMALLLGLTLVLAGACADDSEVSTPTAGSAEVGGEPATSGQESPDAEPEQAPLPPPPVSARAHVPRDVEPRLLNALEVQRFLQETYPPVLRDSGVEGEAQIRFVVRIDGRPEQAAVEKTSGYAAMDSAALAAVQEMRFSPAELRDQPVAVPVTMAVEFKVLR